MTQGLGVSGAALVGLLLIGFGPAASSTRRRRRATGRPGRARERALLGKRRAPGFWALVGGALILGVLAPASLPVGFAAGAVLAAVYRFAGWHYAAAAGFVVLAALALAPISSPAADTAALESLILLTSSLAAILAAQRKRLR